MVLIRYFLRSHAVKILAFRTLLVAILLSAFTACREEQGESDAEEDREIVNNWILQKMRTYYYWNESILNLNPDKRLQSEDYFNALLYKRGLVDGDRFSWYQSSYQDLIDLIYAKNNNDPGFAFALLLMNGQHFLQVYYLKPNSNAQAAGLARGDLIAKINGVSVSSSNYQSLLNQTNLSLSVYRYNESGTYQALGTVGFATNQSFFEQPILLDSLYTITNGTNTKKIGYIVYNRFVSDPENGTNEYDILLNRKLAYLKAKGAESLIIDLRYNRGGYISCALRLASALVPENRLDGYLGSMKFNPRYQAALEAQNTSDASRNYFVREIPGLNTSYTIQNANPGPGKLYFLVGPNTASASEILIFGLKAYEANTMIGTRTRGKFMGSYTLYELNHPVVKCGIQPLVCKYFNSLGESGPNAGMDPDIDMSSEPGLIPYALGSETEPLLRKAFDNILPNWHMQSNPSDLSNKLSIKARNLETLAKKTQVTILRESLEEEMPQGAIIPKLP